MPSRPPEAATKDPGPLAQCLKKASLLAKWLEWGALGTRMNASPWLVTEAVQPPWHGGARYAPPPLAPGAAHPLEQRVPRRGLNLPFPARHGARGGAASAASRQGLSAWQSRSPSPNIVGLVIGLAIGLDPGTAARACHPVVAQASGSSRHHDGTTRGRSRPAAHHFPCRQLPIQCPSRHSCVYRGRGIFGLGGHAQRNSMSAFQDTLSGRERPKWGRQRSGRNAPLSRHWCRLVAPPAVVGPLMPTHVFNGVGNATTAIAVPTTATCEELK